MRLSAMTLFMKVTGSLTGGHGVHWLSVPGHKRDSYAAILGLNEIGRRPLRIASTAVRKTPAGVAQGGPDASVRHAH